MYLQSEPDEYFSGLRNQLYAKMHGMAWQKGWMMASVGNLALDIFIKQVVEIQDEIMILTP